ETEFVFFFDRRYDSRYIYGPNVRPVVLSPPARHPLLYLAWFEFRLPQALKGCDAFFSPDGYLSLRADPKIAQYPVFHDLAFERFPRDIDWFHRMHYRKFFPLYAKRAKTIFAVSHSTQADIVRFYGVRNVEVVGAGAASHFFPTDGRKAREKIGGPYFLYAGAIQPRKNVAGLLRAFDLHKQRTQSAVKLVVAGRKAWKYADVEAVYQSMTHKNDVIFTGYVNDAELNELYCGATALIYVSFFEGFGLPILEAFHSETPVICSDVSSMPEVAGDAALQVNPYEPESIARAMERIDETLSDEARRLRQTLIARGRARREIFAWEQTARIIAQTVEFAPSNAKG
ncbi:MAG: glycosyltransferase family 1 protein, partial [Bacteroidia bacterium]|nr:glycosyltransferase family 1 protein [Bacteroidia bacterium]